MIELEWKRDSKGYRLKPAVPATAAAAATLVLGGEGEPERIVRDGGKLESYRPTAQYDRLFVNFANISSVDGLLGFVNQYGPLTGAGNDSVGDSVEELLRQARDMKRLIEPLKKAQLGERLLDGPTGLLGRAEVSLVLDENRRCVLRLTAPNLLTALWLQFGQAAAGGVQLRTCQHCQDIFSVGPGTGRRLDAMFCSAKHKRTHFSLKRSRRDPK